MLRVNAIHAGYNASEVLHGIDLQLMEGEVVTLLGRNGMGKSSMINCITGQLGVRSGSIEFNGVTLNSIASYQIARLGIGLVPEERHIFPNLSVRENLIVAAANYSAADEPWTLQTIFELFPRLCERQNQPGNQLSGGEQQMLAIGRALMINPKLLILDEATEGLAPLICKEIWQVVGQLKQQGQSILIVDKNLNTLLSIADRYYIMEKGQVVSEGPVAVLASDKVMQARYLGV